LAIRSLKTGVYSRSMLVGNDYYIPPAFESIATATGTSSSGTITFSSIPSTFKHLQIRALIRTDEAGATETNCYLQVNGVTSSSYAYHWLRGNGTAAAAAGAATQTITFPANATGASAAASTMGVFIADILDYGSTTKNKTFRYFSGYDLNGSGEVRVASGLFNLTNAITSIELKTSAGNWTTASSFALYGIKEA